MSLTALLDTNILLRHILQDHPDHSLRSTALIRRISIGELTVRLSETVIFETIYVLGGRYAVPRSLVREQMLSLLDLPGMILPGKEIYREVFDRWRAEPSLSFADSYHISLAKSLGLTEIISFDQKMGKDPGVKRIEP